MVGDKEYVLGTHDEEIERLQLQHNVWRPRALDAWRRAGFTTGQTIVDVGCGPGYASTDLSDIVGPGGKVIALDRSRRFLDVLATRCERLGIQNITVRECDFNESELGVRHVDGAWARWIFAFVANPRQLLERVTESLNVGACVVLHEYLDYSTWRLVPRSEAFEEFVGVVMKSWRDASGEPDVGLAIPGWLEVLGFDLVSVLPILDFVRPENFVWRWPRAFIDSNITRLLDLGILHAEQAETIRSSVADIERLPHARMVTPTLVEIIAKREAGLVEQPPNSPVIACSTARRRPQPRPESL